MVAPRPEAHRPVTAITPVVRGHETALDDLLTQLADAPSGSPRIDFESIAGLHFAAWLVVANDPGFQPTLVMEATYDGDEESFFDQLIANGESAVDAIYRHCEGYPERGAIDAATIKRYLCAHLIAPSACFISIPRMSADCIRNAIAVRSE